MTVAASFSTSFEESVSNIVLAIEATGTAIMVVGGVAALVIGLAHACRKRSRGTAFEETRRNLGRAILLGLEVLIIADIVRTIVVDQTLDSVLVLGAIVIIRIVLSFSLEVEMNGTWPWSLWRFRAQQPFDDGGPRDSAEDPPN